MSECNILQLEGNDLSDWRQRCTNVPSITARGKVDGRLEVYRACKKHKQLVEKHGLKIIEERKQHVGTLVEKNRRITLYVTELENGLHRVTLGFSHPICFFNIGFEMTKEQVDGLKKEMFAELEETPY